MSLESQTQALLDERRALQDMSYTLTNSPRKTVKPKDVSVNAAASEKSPTLPQKDEGKDISPATKKPMKQTDGKNISLNITQSPTDASLSPSSITSDKMQPHEQVITDDEEYTGSPISMKRMFGTLNQSPSIFLPSPSPLAMGLSPSPGLSSLNLDDSPTTFDNEGLDWNKNKPLVVGSANHSVIILYKADLSLNDTTALLI
ncbi:hypothetical protein GWK47_038699 [Chionoecetes opilio]|uniref:Uncharacterized protein n=1 Tax=Chionoecetes opilio TaxID=41210 RepID=A0A8J4YF22_CHIOP|nr:hypothetical protein GWK47_038699 [Chionoecetes opilio]